MVQILYDPSLLPSDVTAEIANADSIFTLVSFGLKLNNFVSLHFLEFIFQKVDKFTLLTGVIIM